MASAQDRKATMHIDGINDSTIVNSVDACFELSASFSINIDFASTNTLYSADNLVGKSVMITLADNANDAQILNGFISALHWGEITTDRMREYQIVVVPWLDFLKLNRDCRIFQNQTVPEIIATIFKKYPFAKYDFDSLQYSYEARPYCTQYNETDYDFINRLLEESGIYYTFTHTNDSHILSFADLGFSVTPFAMTPPLTQNQWANHISINGHTTVRARPPKSVVVNSTHSTQITQTNSAQPPQPKTQYLPTMFLSTISIPVQ